MDTRSVPKSFIRVTDNNWVACYDEKRSGDTKDAWFMSEMRALVPEVNEGAVTAFCLRISQLDPWRRDAEMKLMLESVRHAQESRSDDYGRLSLYGADTSWRAEARDRLNVVDNALFDDLLEQEERDKAKDAERRAKCAEQARLLAN